jgi:hypothetical protein
MKNAAPKKSSISVRKPKTNVTEKPSVKETKQMTMITKHTNAISPEKRNKMISDAAYYLAEKSGFNPNLTTTCWLEAEKQIDNNMLDL